VSTDRSCAICVDGETALEVSRASLLVVVGVDLDVLLPLLRNLILGEDGIHRARLDTESIASYAGVQIEPRVMSPARALRTGFFHAECVNCFSAEIIEEALL
jgi:hypothetical protein